MRSIPPTIVLAVLLSGALFAADATLLAPKPAPEASESAQSRTVYAEDGQKQAVSGRPAASDEEPRTVAIDEAIQVFRQATEQQGLRGGPRAARSGPSGLLWHGRVYEYLRNNALDATPHEIVQNGGDQNLLRRNQYGFSVSGPVILPKLYDGRRRAFFTLSWEATRENVGRSYLRTLPSLPQRSGDFSDLVDSAGNPVTIYDPASTFENPAYDPTQVVSESNLEYIRDPFANNRIATTRLDRAAAAATEQYPLPNTNIGPFLTNNFFSNPTATSRPSGFVARVDQTILQRHKLTVDLARSRGFIGEPRIYDTVANPGRPDRNFFDQRIVVRDTFAVSPAVVYEASVAADSSVVETEHLTIVPLKIRFVVKCVHMTGAALHKDEDHAFGARSKQWRAGCEGIRGECRAGRCQACQSQGAKSAGCGAQGLPTGHEPCPGIHGRSADPAVEKAIDMGLACCHADRWKFIIKHAPVQTEN